MRTTFIIATDLLREAAARKWIIALGVGMTLLLAVMGLALRLEVVDGALAAVRLFGNDMEADITSVDMALRPVFRAAAYLIFYGGLGFGILACADFGPSLLSPGRIEHLLSLPMKRWQLLLGTFLGVLILAALGGLYGAGGITLILGFKTGHWTPLPLASGLLASFSFAALYGAMLASAVFVRNASVSASVGGLLYVGGTIAGYRSLASAMFEPGLGRRIFELVTLPLPKISELADMAGDLAGSASVDTYMLLRLVAGQLVFGIAALAIGVWRFENKDF